MIGDDAPEPIDLAESRAAFSAALREADEGPSGAAGDATSSEPPRFDASAVWDAADYLVAQRYGPVAEALEGLDDDTAQALAYIARTYATNPERAARELAALLGVDGGDPDDVPVTRAELRAHLEALQDAAAEEAEAAEQLERARGELRSVAAGLGFEPGSDGYRQLLTVARDRFAHLPVPEALREAAKLVRPPEATDEPRTLEAAARAFRAAL